MAKSVDVERKSSTYSDEKVNVNEKTESVNSAPGEVYADVRDIDLDEDGKERPIGMSHSHYIRVKSPYLQSSHRY